jgi:GWxTD domain-containing protein
LPYGDESLLFYHPAIWWISKTIRSEREQCCDDFVVATTGNAFAYAAALSTLEENRSRIGDLAMAATGGTLMKRIHRLLNHPVGPGKMPAAAPLVLICAGLMIFIGASLVVAWPSHSVRVEPRKAAPIPQPPAPSALPIETRQGPAGGPALSSALQNWLEQDVVYIITPQERTAFEALRTDQERARFIEQFWERRDPTPGTPENEFKDEHYRRIVYTNQRFTTLTTPGWKSDRGRIYIMWGPPDDRVCTFTARARFFGGRLHQRLIG